MFFSCFTFFCWNREYTGYFICIGWTWGSHLCRRGFGALFCHVCNRCISVKGEWLAVSHAVWMPSFFGIAPRSGCVFFPLKTKKWVVLFYIESASLRIANFCRIFHKKRPIVMGCPNSQIVRFSKLLSWKSFTCTDQLGTHLWEGSLKVIQWKLLNFNMLHLKLRQIEKMRFLLKTHHFQIPS